MLEWSFLFSSQLVTVTFKHFRYISEFKQDYWSLFSVICPNNSFLFGNIPTSHQSCRNNIWTNSKSTKSHNAIVCINFKSRRTSFNLGIVHILSCFRFHMAVPALHIKFSKKDLCAITTHSVQLWIRVCDPKDRYAHINSLILVNHPLLGVPILQKEEQIPSKTSSRQITQLRVCFDISWMRNQLRESSNFPILLKNYNFMHVNMSIKI